MLYLEIVKRLTDISPKLLCIYIDDIASIKPFRLIKVETTSMEYDNIKRLVWRKEYLRWKKIFERWLCTKHKPVKSTDM